MRRSTGSIRPGVVAVTLLVAVWARVGFGANYRFGLDFIETATPAPAGAGFLAAEFQPFPITNLSTNFVVDGGLAGWTEEEVRQQILLRVEDVYRAIDTGDPDTTVRFALYLGTVPQSISGSRYNVALGAGPFSIWGEQHNVSIDNYTAAVYLNKIDEAFVANPNISWDTPEKVLNAISGTTAHEIGHRFLGDYHAPAGPEEPYDIMAIPATGLTTEARFTVRRFSDQTTALLLPEIGTVNRADFDMNDWVDGQDIDTLLANFGRTDALFQDADTNGDHTVDGRDINTLISNFSGVIDPPSEGMAVAQYNPATGEFAVSADGVMSWTLLSEGQFTGTGLGGLSEILAREGESNLVSANANTIGDGNFDGPVSYSGVSLGRLTDPGCDPGVFTLEYVTGRGGQRLQGTISVVPEPSTVVMLLGAVVGLYLWQRRLR